MGPRPVRERVSPGRGLAGHVAADEARKEHAADPAYPQQIRLVLEKYCFGCHGEKIAKSNLRLDTLAADFRTARTAATWKEIMVRVADQAEDAMPPKGKPRPSAEEIKAIREWIEARLTAVAAADAAAQKAEGRAQLRRLNRVEYNNTLRDLLGIAVDLKPLLPEDDVVAGFDNVGSGLQITRIHHERYLEAAETALNSAIVLGPRPKATTRKLTFRKDGYPPRRALENDAVVFFTSASAELQQSRVPVAGPVSDSRLGAPLSKPGPAAGHARQLRQSEPSR